MWDIILPVIEGSIVTLLGVFATAYVMLFRSDVSDDIPRRRDLFKASRYSRPRGRNQ